MQAYSVEYIDSRNKAIIKYKRYKYFRNKLFYAWFVAWLVLVAFSLYSVWEFGLTYILGVLFLCCIVFTPLYLVWNYYVERKNRKIEENIIFPIIDKQLATNAKKYPSVCTVIKKKLIKEIEEKDAYNPGDESVLVRFKNGDVCEYHFRYLREEDNLKTMVKELTLTQYLCADERKIEKIKGLLPAYSDKSSALLLLSGLLFIGLILLLPTLILISKPDGFKIFGYIVSGLLSYLILLSIILSLLDNLKGKHKKIEIILSLPLAIAYLFLKLTMPLMMLLLTTMWVIFFSALPFTTILMLVNGLGLNISGATICFITLVLGSFIIVYLPTYVKWAISIIPMIRHTEGKPFNKHMAEFMRYAYDPHAVNFLLNIIYVALVIVMCIMQLQHRSYLFSKDMDEAVTNAFVVFLAFEGIKNSFKSVRLSSTTFLKKMLATIFD